MNSKRLCRRRPGPCGMSLLWLLLVLKVAARELALVRPFASDQEIQEPLLKIKRLGGPRTWIRPSVSGMWRSRAAKL